MSEPAAPSPLLPVSEARRRVLDGLAPVPVELVSLAAAWNRVSAAPVAARLANPPADVSAMDGYALSGDALPDTPLRLLGEAAAGHPFAGRVGPGEAVRLFTGSVVPAGADRILIQEHAERGGDSVSPIRAVDAGRHIRRQGQDFAPGTELVPAGRRLGARDIGLLAAGGASWVSVRRRPRVMILATGDEVVLPGDPVPFGSVVNSNTPMLSALVTACGAEATVLPPVPDERAALAAALGQASGADLVLTVGGASVGDHDLVRQGLEDHGLRLGFWRIAMRPGKPMLHGTIRTAGGTVPVLGLPGNPVSALVCALVFAVPALRLLAGETTHAIETERAIVTAALDANDERADHLRASLVSGPDGPRVSPFPRQDSGMLRRLAESEALILRAPFAPPVAAGGAVEIIRLDRFGL